MDTTDIIERPSFRGPLPWCGHCAACAAAARVATEPCGCPAGRGCGTRTAAPAATYTPDPTAGRATTWPSCLAALGDRLRHALHYRSPLSMLPRLSNRDVLAVAIAMIDHQAGGGDAAELTMLQAVSLVAGHLRHLADTGGYADASVTKVMSQVGSLSYFMDASGKTLVADIDRALIKQWVGSRIGGRRRHGNQPGASTVRNRLSAARLFFRVLQRLGVHAADPTVGLHGPGRGGRTSRPADDTEILLLRYSLVGETDGYRRAAGMALAEATATTSELSLITTVDIDLAEATVALPGSGRHHPRTGLLSSWGVTQLRRRIEWLQQQHGDTTATLAVTYSGGGDAHSAGAAAAALMRSILETAGLGDEPELKPASIPASYGRRLWQQTRDLQIVAAALGYTSFDTAATRIGLDDDDLPENQGELLRGAVLDANSHGPIDALRGAARGAARTQAGGAR